MVIKPTDLKLLHFVYMHLHIKMVFGFSVPEGPDRIECSFSCRSSVASSVASGIHLVHPQNPLDQVNVLLISLSPVLHKLARHLFYLMDCLF